MTDNLFARRGFLAGLTATVAGVIATALGVSLTGYTILPALRRGPEQWLDVGQVDRLPLNEPKSLVVTMTVKDGWWKTSSVKSVWAVRQEGGEVVVFSGLCPHLGCGFRWEAERRVFLCPCHQSFFALDGSVLSGPAPRPLDRLPVKFEGGRLYVSYKEFKFGTAAKIEL